jgi:transposase-like protein
MGKHKHYDADLKIKVVLEVLKGQKSLAQICREYEVSADLVCH